jgi:RNA polymerase sigma-70 factor (ECF subfamily)
LVSASSFDAIFREHFAYVWRVARALAGAELADDVTQETFLLVRRRLDAFDGPSMRAWLYGIARNVARNALRGRERREHRHRTVPRVVPDTATQRWAEVQEAADLMERFLARLPAPQREAFMLKELEELTAAEIAEAIGVPLQTVYSRVRAAHKQLERFRRELEGDAA